MGRKFTDNQVLALIRLGRQFLKGEWVVVTASHRKSLGNLMDEMPLYTESSGVQYFNYPNYPEVVDGMIVDAMKQIHGSMKSYYAARRVTFK